MTAPDPPRGRWLRNVPTWHGPHCAAGQLCTGCLRGRRDVVIGPPAGCRGQGVSGRWAGVYAPAENGNGPVAS